ncbi:MAG: hypothetical protein J6V32_04725 [Elusimicrobiaceae bacterium]|nr:hypothetical protein [Elusimicrobiaceae bacterium]
MKRIVVGMLALLLAGSVVAAEAAKKAPAKAKAKTKAEFIIIESDEYEAGKEDPALTQGISEFLEATPSVTRVSVKDVAANPKLANLDYSFLPLYLIKKNKTFREKMAQPIQYGYVQENDEFLILPHQTRQGVFNNKEPQPDVLDLFVMSQCPYGVRAEDFIIKAKKEGTFPADKTVRIRYIVDYSPERGFNSLHGSGEWEENIRQLLIAKYYPNKFWKYLEIRNKDYRSSRWDKAMEDAGISVKKITKKFDTEGVELLKEEAKYAKEFGISASPSVIWEGKVQMGLDGAARLKGFEFFNPSAPSGVPAAPSGSC